MPDRYPGYDVLAKRDTPSWNEQTRRVVDARLAIGGGPRFLDAGEFATLAAVCARIVPQSAERPAIPVAALVDCKLHLDAADGYRDARLPRMREAWRRGLRALDEEAMHAHGKAFADLDGAAQDRLLRQMQRGELDSAAWEGMPSRVFFESRMAHDIVQAYYAHPTAWNEIGFGGPASPRGYVRMGFDRRDDWEAVELHDGDDVELVRRENRRVR